jgi:hypothetical protein
MDRDKLLKMINILEGNCENAAFNLSVDGENLELGFTNLLLEFKGEMQLE